MCILENRIDLAKLRKWMALVINNQRRIRKKVSVEMIQKRLSRSLRELSIEFCWKLHVVFVPSGENEPDVLIGKKKRSLEVTDDVECSDCSVSPRGLIFKVCTACTI